MDWSLFFTALSGIGAVAAAILAWVIYRRQEKIALFNRRMQIMDDYERFVLDKLPDWDWRSDVSPITRYSDVEMAALFNQEFVDLRSYILESAQKCSNLHGDLEHATRKGDCKGRSEEDIEKEISKLISEVSEKYKKARAVAIQKWLTI